MPALAEPPERIAPATHSAPKTVPQPLKQVSSWRKNAIRVIIAISVLSGTGFGVRTWLHSRSWESTDDAFIAAHVQQVSSRISARVETVLVEDNQLVKAGDVLVQLDERDLEVALEQAQAKLRSAQANVGKAEAQLLAAEAGAEQAAAQLESRKAELENAETELTRHQRLRESGAVSQREFDDSETEARTDRAHVVAAEKQLSSVEAGIRYMKANIEAAKSAVAEAESGLAKAKLDRSYSTIVANQNGRVTARNVEPGNYVQPGQALMAVVSDDVWVEANFKETQLTKMRAGQPVDVHIDAYPDLDLRGHVESIQAGSGAQFSLLPPENATGNYVKVVQRVPVKITLDLPEKGVALLGPGMSVVPDVRVRE